MWSQPSLCFQKEDLKIELQPAVCMENKLEPVVPNKIGECEVWFLGFSFQQVRAWCISCRGQVPGGPKSVIAGRGLHTFPSHWNLHLQHRSARSIWKALGSSVTLIVVEQEPEVCWPILLSRSLTAGQVLLRADHCFVVVSPAFHTSG